MQLITARIFFLICLFCLLLSDQSVSALDISPYNSYNYYDPEAQIKVDQDRVQNVSQEPMPHGETLLFQELNKLEAEISAIKNRLSNNSFSGADEGLKDLSDQILSSSNALANLDCDKNSKDYRSSVSNYTKTLQKLNSFVMYLYVDTQDLNLPLPTYFTVPQSTDLENCKAIKETLKSSDFKAKQQRVFADLQASLSAAKSTHAKLDEADTKLLNILNERKAKIQAALSSNQPQKQITADLPLILAILGGACVLAIVGIRLFDQEIQMEWVTSGQVIQFVTVMVLLSVVTALALSNILTENTLGTLLGGIAGYVLAQGVGRAAARDVTRNVLRPSTQWNSGSATQLGSPAQAGSGSPAQAGSGSPTQAESGSPAQAGSGSPTQAESGSPAQAGSGSPAQAGSGSPAQAGSSA